MPEPVRLRRTIHYTELPDLPPEDPLCREWDFFRRELPRLLAEGHEGKFVLVKGEEIIGLFPTEDDAVRVGYAKFLPESFLVEAIRTEERILFLPWYCWPCRT